MNDLFHLGYAEAKWNARLDERAAQPCFQEPNTQRLSDERSTSGDAIDPRRVPAKNEIETV